MELVIHVQYLEETVCISLPVNDPEKDMNLFVVYTVAPAMSK